MQFVVFYTSVHLPFYIIVVFYTSFQWHLPFYIVVVSYPSFYLLFYIIVVCYILFYLSCLQFMIHVDISCIINISDMFYLFQKVSFESQINLYMPADPFDIGAHRGTVAVI